MEELTDRLLKRYSRLDSDWLTKSHRLQEVAEYLLPDRASFYNVKTSASQDRELIFDSTAEDSLQTLAAGLHSYLSSAMQAWFSLDLVMGEQYSTDEINDWIDEVQKTMLAKFNSDVGGFHSSAHEFYIDLPGLGTACFFVDEVDGQIRFMCIPLNEIRFAENHRGVIDTIYRKFEMTASQIESKWKGKASDQIMTALENEPDKKFDILHVVEPRRDFKQGSINPKEMEFASYYLEMDSKNLLKESGYMEMPMMVARWSKNSGEVHGRGIGQKALPDIRTLNEMQRTALIAAEKQGDPVTLLPSEGFIGDFKSDGGGLNYYRSTGNIRDKVMTLGSEADLNAILAMIGQKQDAIRKMFLTDKLQKLDGPSMTATEVIAVQNEKMRVLGPVLGRLQGEFLAPLINRVFKIMLRNGELPPAPEELANQEVRIQYVSPISRAQKQVEAEAFGNALAFLTPVIQMSPGVLDNFDFDTVARDSQDLFGFPNKYLKTPDDVKKMREAQAQAQAEAAEVQQTAQGLAVAAAAKEVAQ